MCSYLVKGFRKPPFKFKIANSSSDQLFMKFLDIPDLSSYK
ncbi:hypothetical protein ADIARSV_0015 [Arcticibacter svalbardensis MN12-7]|uniref:Uncharacterized protein n=1 Tax=Arcticibacter svalbardensis MN12-7 TaxID=1150600 RepID=R9GY68_9SPHI|nr:hypothetical protein ADIARSV_0015 [Arcticibacter svalbardensis MN12-7]